MSYPFPDRMSYPLSFLSLINVISSGEGTLLMLNRASHLSEILQMLRVALSRVYSNTQQFQKMN